MRRSFRTPLTTLAATALVFWAGQALAIGTAADTTISNTASVEFTIGGLTPPPVDSNPREFKVDRKIRVIVVSDGNTNVVANVNDFALPFTVTNESNTAGGTNDYFQLTTEAVVDDFDMNNVRIYLDANGNGQLDGGDSDITGTPVIIGNGVGTNSKKFLIVSDTPATATAPSLDAAYHLIATAWAGANAGDGALPADGDGNDPTLSEVVYADDAGSATSDDALEGQHSDSGVYTTLATLGIDKQASDGTSGYHIPGDELTYTITVTNADPANAASGVTITDSIPANTEFKDGSLLCTASGVGVAGTAELSDDNGATWTAGAGDTITDVRCYNGTVVIGGGTATMTFIVTIQ